MLDFRFKIKTTLEGEAPELKKLNHASFYVCSLKWQLKSKNSLTVSLQMMASYLAWESWKRWACENETSTKMENRGKLIILIKCTWDEIVHVSPNSAGRDISRRKVRLTFTTRPIDGNSELRCKNTRRRNKQEINSDHPVRREGARGYILTSHALAPVPERMNHSGRLQNWQQTHFNV